MKEIFFAKNTTDQKVCRGMWNVEFYTKILIGAGGGMSTVYSVSTVFTVVKKPSTHLPYISNFKVVPMARGTAIENAGTPCSLCLWPGVFGNFESLYRTVDRRNR